MKTIASHPLSAALAISLLVGEAGCRTPLLAGIGPPTDGAPMTTDSGAPPDGMTTSDLPSVQSFTAVPSAVFIGEHTQLVALFIGDSASIDGIGPVESGKAVDTAPLSRSMTFTLTVRRGASQVQAHLDVRASYRNRFRQLAQSPVARTHHFAAALPDGGALVMGGSSSEYPHLPDSYTSQRFDPASETMVQAPQLIFTVLSPDSVLVPLDAGRILLVLGGPNAFAQVGNAARATQLFAGLVDSQFLRVGDLQVDHRYGGLLTTLSDGVPS